MSSTALRWSTVTQPANTVPALHLFGNVTVEGVILAGQGNHCSFVAGALSDSYTLSNDASCGLNGTGSANNVPNLDLGPRATTTVNGVDQTYYPLLDGSPAIDAAPSVTRDTALQIGPDTDQLGTTRPTGQRCDVGAIEGMVLYPAALCANQWNGALSMARNGDCGRSDILIELPWDAPLTLCVNTWNGATRASNQCNRSEHVVIATGDGAVKVCVNNWNGALRVSDRCSRSERADSL